MASIIDVFLRLDVDPTKQDLGKNSLLALKLLAVLLGLLQTGPSRRVALAQAIETGKVGTARHTDQGRVAYRGTSGRITTDAQSAPLACPHRVVRVQS